MTTAQPKQSKHSYIIGLDGLRAIAVLLVLFYHVEIPHFKAGYIGVDIFFTISGFIITRQIMLSMEAGKFSLVEFWKRRVARLLPAVFVVSALSMVAGFFILSPGDLVAFAKSAAFAVASLSNYFFFSEAGYFDSSAITKPLLHTWSLGVEEQFYLFWPLLMVFAFSLGKRIGVIGVVGLLTALSFVGAIWYNYIDPNAVFFWMPFRVYQFGIGALIAAFTIRLTQNWTVILSLIGLAVIMAITVMNPLGVTAIWYTGLGSALASALVLASIENSFSQKILGHPVMRWVGLRAYSIYLVHWPIIVFSYMSGIPIEPLWQIIWIVASFILGHMLFVFIETPIRFGKATSGSRKEAVLLGVIGSLAALMTLNLYFILSNGFPGRVSTEIAALEQEALTEKQKMVNLSRVGKCALNRKQTFDDMPMDECISFVTDKPNVLVTGDSFSDGAYVGLARFNRAGDYNLSQMRYPGCWPVDYSEIGDVKQCAAYNEKRLEVTYREPFDVVVISASWSGNERNNNIDPFEPVLKRLKEEGKKVIVVGVRPTFKEDVPRLIVGFNDLARANERMFYELRYPYDDYLAWNEKLKTMVESYGFRYADIFDNYCQPNNCNALTEEGRLIFRDNGHLTEFGSRQLARWIHGELRKTLR